MFKEKAQVTLEFTFCIIIALLLGYACLKAFRWSALDLVYRRDAHEKSLIKPVSESWQGLDTNSPINQLDGDFYRGTKMNLVFNNW